MTRVAAGSRERLRPRRAVLQGLARSLRLRPREELLCRLGALARPPVGPTARCSSEAVAAAAWLGWRASKERFLLGLEDGLRLPNCCKVLAAARLRPLQLLLLLLLLLLELLDPRQPLLLEVHVETWPRNLRGWLAAGTASAVPRLLVAAAVAARGLAGAAASAAQGTASCAALAAL